MAAAAATVADPQVRHRGTFGGALAHADPAGDLPGRRPGHWTPIRPSPARAAPAPCRPRSFFVDYLETALGDGRAAHLDPVPKLGAGWGVHYEKFNRVAQAWSIVGVAAAVRGDNGRSPRPGSP